MKLYSGGKKKKQQQQLDKPLYIFAKWLCNFMLPDVDLCWAFKLVDAFILFYLYI